MKGRQPLTFDRTFRLCSTGLGNWTVEWDDGIPRMVMGNSAAYVMERALAQVNVDTIPTSNNPKLEQP